MDLFLYEQFRLQIFLLCSQGIFFLGGGGLYFHHEVNVFKLKTIVFTFMIVDNVKLILDNEKDHTQNDLFCGEFPVTCLYSNVC